MSKFAFGVALKLPKEYYQAKLIQQSHQWRTGGGNTLYRATKLELPKRPRSIVMPNRALSLPGHPYILFDGEVWCASLVELIAAVVYGEGSLESLRVLPSEIREQVLKCPRRFGTTPKLCEKRRDSFLRSLGLENDPEIKEMYGHVLFGLERGTAPLHLATYDNYLAV